MLFWRDLTISQRFTRDRVIVKERTLVEIDSSSVIRVSNLPDYQSQIERTRKDVYRFQVGMGHMASGTSFASPGQILS